MKETTGELNMTIVTIVAVSAIGALIWFVIMPLIQGMIANTTCEAYGDDWHAVKTGGTRAEGDGTLSEYACCPADVNDASSTACIQP